MFRKIIFSLILLLAVLAIPKTASAQGSELRCDGGRKLNTAIGCIPVEDIDELVGFFLGWGLGIGGGIAFLFILYAGFIITTSSGDPKKLQAGKELMTSAIAGLMLLIFSIFLLRLIGVDILGIPGFGG